jgi:GT2 family glycosyltransferase
MAAISDIGTALCAAGDMSSGSLSGSTVAVVVGMHRSGTSAIAGVMRHLGLAFGSRLMEASPDNPRGYWEHLDVVAVHQRLMTALGYDWDDIRPLPPDFAETEAASSARRDLAAILIRDFAGCAFWGVKDPRLCRLLGLWLPLLDQAGATPGFVLTLRHPLDVAASLEVRDGLSGARALLLWLRHVLEAERQTRDRRRTIVHYEDLVGERGWRAVAAQIARDLRLTWPDAEPTAAAAIDAYLSPDLRHNRLGEYNPGPNGEALWGWIDAVYSAFRGAAQIGDTCDAIAAELARADQLFVPILNETAAAKGLLARAELHATELRALVLRQDAELKALPRAMPNPVVPPVAGDDAYPRWMASRSSTALARPQWIAERAQCWPYPPTLALGMIVPAGTEARVAATLQSLRLQVAGEWELHVAAEGDAPEVLSGEKRLFWQQPEDRPADALNRVLSGSTAHWIALIDAGDQLAAHALFALGGALFDHPEWGAVYSDEDRVDPQGLRSGPHFKPDFNLELLRGLPYVGGLLAVRREIFAEIGGFDAARDGTEEYDLALRLAERLGPGGFGHIADVLYHRLTISGRSKRPVAAICADMPTVVQAHLDRCSIAATAEIGTQPHFCRVRYHHAEPPPLVSVIVPTRNQLALLKRCVETVLKVTKYENYELVIVDNGSTDADARDYLQSIEDKYPDIGSRIRVLRHPGDFNFSAMNNRAVREAARGEYICLLNNDTAPLDGDWLGEMMSLARRPDIGIVGAKLFYPDGRLQHAGVILGIGWGAPAEHPYNGEPGTTYGYWGRAQVAQDLSAVTAACLVVRRAVYEAVDGLDEKTFAVAYNDVDFCLRVAAAGYRVVWTPFALLLHEAAASQRAAVEGSTQEALKARFADERNAMFQRWLPRIAFDPAYNRNLTSFGAGFVVESEGPPTWDPEFRPRPRVIAYPADREGCGEYRIIAPSRALFQSGRAHCCETMRLGTPPEIARVEPDSIMLQRQLEWHQIEFIGQLKRTSSAARVFEIDDLITNLPPKSVHRKAIAPDIGTRLRKAVALCDRLVVSTEPLASAYGRLCDEVVVLPNRLEKSRWIGLAPKRQKRPKPRVGWAGAVGHSGDLAVIASVVEATAREVDWVFFGMCPDNLRRFVAEAHDWVPLHDYAEKLASLDLDLAVAPLEHHPFNDAKSNLRLLEYGILGYPVVCSDIVPYQGDLPVTRVANRHLAWTKTVRDMTADRGACRRAGESLRQAVLKDWMLDDHLDDCMRAWLPR